MNAVCERAFCSPGHMPGINPLPETFRSADSLNAFKRLFKTYLFTLAFDVA